MESERGREAGWGENALHRDAELVCQSLGLPPSPVVLDLRVESLYGASALTRWKSLADIKGLGWRSDVSWA